MTAARGSLATLRRRTCGAVARVCLHLGICVSLLATGCSDSQPDRGCTPNDQDGLVGVSQRVLLNVSDTGYAVGGIDSGSSQPNIAVQNSSTVTLTVTNVGTRPHGLRIACLPTHLPAACAQQSCFPESAHISGLAPSEHVTVMFETPLQEGAYPFTSEEPGDTTTNGDGTMRGLLGQFVLM